MDVVTALDRLPKVELHCHVEGTMRPGTVVELAAKNGIELPTSDPTELYRYSSLDTFLEIFWLVQSTLGSRDDWAQLAYESIVDGAAHGLVYRETFFTPARHLDAGQDLADIVAGLSEGLAAAEDETGVGRCSLPTSTGLRGGGRAGHGPAAGRAARGGQPRGRAGHRGRAGLDRAGVDPTDFAGRSSWPARSGCGGPRIRERDAAEPHLGWTGRAGVRADRPRAVECPGPGACPEAGGGADPADRLSQLERRDRQRRASAGAARVPADAGGGAPGHPQHRRPGAHRP